MAFADEFPLRLLRRGLEKLEEPIGGLRVVGQGQLDRLANRQRLTRVSVTLQDLEAAVFDGLDDAQKLDDRSALVERLPQRPVAVGQRITSWAAEATVSDESAMERLIACAHAAWPSSLSMHTSK